MNRLLVSLTHHRGRRPRRWFTYIEPRLEGLGEGPSTLKNADVPKPVAIAPARCSAADCLVLCDEGPAMGGARASPSRS